MSTAPRVTVPPDARVNGAVDMGILLGAVAPDLGAARDRVRTDTYRGALDAVTKELVRLRNARFTGCEF